MVTITILLLGLELYFAAILGVSGLAKLDNPEQFAAILRRHHILPTWSIARFSKLFPWLEVILAIWLVMGIKPLLSAGLIFILFAGFLIVETVLVVTKRASECGCYGIVYRQKVDGASIATAVILCLLALMHWFAIAKTAPVSLVWRLPVIVIFSGMSGWLALKVIKRKSVR